MAATSAPIPIPQNHPTELQELISFKSWPEVIERCRSHPHEVGSNVNHRNDRGYTALHTLTAYNHDVDGDALVPVVTAILTAADEIDYGAAYRLGSNNNIDDDSGAAPIIHGENGTVMHQNDGTNANANAYENSRVNTNEIVERRGDEDSRNRGSWRLLLDQNNRAKWSPLHLICVHGGINHGKVSIIKSLLQLNQTAVTREEENQRTQYQTQIINLLDRQHRNILHHLLDSVVPSNETFDTIQFIVRLSPSLLFTEDVRGKTPLSYVLERLMENPGKRRRHYMESYGNDNEGIMKNYKMLRLLVRCMERETRSWNVSQRTTDVNSLGDENNNTFDSTITTPNIGSDENQNNILQLACLLPRAVCPSDGSLIAYLTSIDAGKLEAQVRDEADNNNHNSSSSSSSLNATNMSEEEDASGNHALHIFLTNKSYAGKYDSQSSSGDNSRGCGKDEENTTTPSKVEHEIMQHLIQMDHQAIFTSNNMGQLPLQIAMKAGRRNAISVLVLEYPEAVLLDDSMNNIKYFMYVLSSISDPTNVYLLKTGSEGDDEESMEDDVHAKKSKKCLTAMYELVHAKPDVVSFAGSGSRKEGASTKTKNKWWKRFNPFTSS